jgi:O-antigen/teichoic acid export membrane protein
LNLKFYKTVTCRVAALLMALVAGVVALKLYKHYLRMEVYGVVVVALQILTYLPYLDGGFRTTTNREILASGTREAKLRLIRFAQTFYSHLTLLALPVALLVMAGYSLTPTVTKAGQPRIFFLAVGLTAAVSLLGWTQIELLVGLGEQASFFLMNALNACITLGTLWLCLHLGAGVWAFPLSTLGGLCACYPAAMWLIRRREPAVQFFSFRADNEFWNDLRRLWRGAWSCFRLQVYIVLLYSLDVIIVGLISGNAKDVAIYSIVARFLGLTRNVVQASGEVAWPLVAQKNGADHVFAAFLLRSNGWVIGSVAGALMITLGPFLRLFMGPQWTPPQLLVVLLTARTLVTALSSPASYLLMGAGDFKTIAQYIQRELIGATLLAVLLGAKFGMNGVALGFLVATGFGTLSALYYAYGRSVKSSGGSLMWQAWWRGGTACAVSSAVAAVLLLFAKGTWQIFMVGGIAALAAIASGVAICAFRFRFTGTQGTFRSRLGKVMANI